MAKVIRNQNLHENSLPNVNQTRLNFSLKSFQPTQKSNKIPFQLGDCRIKTHFQ